MDFLDQLTNEIDGAYRDLGHTLGWRFITSPKRTLSPDTDVVFIALNPGGRTNNLDHPSASSEAGSAYLVESWGRNPPGENKLQLQVQSMYEILNVPPESVLSGQMVPFRSPSWDELPNRQESLRFGTAIWKQVLEYVRPRLVIGMGKSVIRPCLLNILGNPYQSAAIPVRWGPVTVSVDKFKYCSVVTFPHLSRFGIMTRGASRSRIEKAFARAGFSSGS